jgi:hypothetical protein
MPEMVIGPSQPSRTASMATSACSSGIAVAMSLEIRLGVANSDGRIARPTATTPTIVAKAIATCERMKP